MDNEELITKALNTVKMLLGIENTDKDNILRYHIQSCIQKVLNYCNIETIPDGLFNVIVEMSVKVYNAWTDDGKYGYENVDGVVSSISRGDFSVSFDTNGQATANIKRLQADDFLIDYKKQLQVYKRVRMI